MPSLVKIHITMKEKWQLKLFYKDVIKMLKEFQSEQFEMMKLTLNYFPFSMFSQQHNPCDAKLIQEHLLLGLH